MDAPSRAAVIADVVGAGGGVRDVVCATANDAYLTSCRARSIAPHPTWMPVKLAEFFVAFSTVQGNLVLDPFARSNTTGTAAEWLGRRWLAIEQRAEYICGSPAA